MLICLFFLMNLVSLFLCIMVKISFFNFVLNDFVWRPGKCPKPAWRKKFRSAWKLPESALVGVRTAYMQTLGYPGKCIYINITKAGYFNWYHFEKITRILNTSNLEWKHKEKGILKVQNGTSYFYGRLFLPFRSLDFNVLSQTTNCLCVFSCENFLLVHRWEFTSYHSNNRWCGFWWYTRCHQKFWTIGINIKDRMTKTEKWWCPKMTEDDDDPPAEPEDCKGPKQCGSFILKAGESVANMVNGVYQKILKKLFNETTPAPAATTSSTTTTTEQLGTTTIPPFYRPAEPHMEPGPLEFEY